MSPTYEAAGNGAKETERYAEESAEDGHRYRRRRSEGKRVKKYRRCKGKGKRVKKQDVETKTRNKKRKQKQAGAERRKRQTGGWEGA